VKTYAAIGGGPEVRPLASTLEDAYLEAVGEP
jgi:hypothetical protein